MRTIALALSLLALALPSAAAAMVVGIGDQQPYMFGDARFQALDIRYSRLSVGWNVLQSRGQAKELARWLAAAQAAGVHPLIAFEHSWMPGRHRRLPSPVQFAAQFRALHTRYPWVTEFAAWNEANYCGQPTCHSAPLVAAYYRQIRRICPTCTALGAELLDEPSMVGWLRSFRRALHGEPQIWGLHNYLGANRLQTASTGALLRASTAPVWFTETAGVVARHNHNSHAFRESPRHAATVTEFIFDRLARLSGRIERVYLYQWQAGTYSREPWDSALIARNGKPRPAFWVLIRELHALGQLPATPAATALLSAAGRVLRSR
ncbi:MAG TPA: hypothetical protein VMS02_03000 [Solirubrobacteraceae bacterium]|nr:hypothetical protein [Solirubrobacteraceae bacterium]